MNVETTPELILAAAEKCPQAKEALKTLFPKVFEEEKDFNCHSLFSLSDGWAIGKNSTDHPCIGIDIVYKYGFYLATNFWDWKLEEKSGLMFLIPTRK